MDAYGNIYRYVHIHEITHTYISLFFPLRGPRIKHISVGTSIPSTQNLVFNNIFQQKEWRSLEKQLILELWQEVNKMSLGHLAVPKVRKCHTDTHILIHNDGAMSKGSCVKHRSQM